MSLSSRLPPRSTGTDMCGVRGKLLHIENQRHDLDQTYKLTNSDHDLDGLGFDSRRCQCGSVIELRPGARTSVARTRVHILKDRPSQCWGVFSCCDTPLRDQNSGANCSPLPPAISTINIQEARSTFSTHTCSKQQSSNVGFQQKQSARSTPSTRNRKRKSEFTRNVEYQQPVFTTGKPNCTHCRAFSVRRWPNVTFLNLPQSKKPAITHCKVTKTSENPMKRQSWVEAELLTRLDWKGPPHRSRLFLRQCVRIRGVGWGGRNIAHVSL